MRPLTRRAFLASGVVLGAGQASAHISAPRQDEVWVMLDPAKQRLQVMRGSRAIVLYNNVSWGRGGVGFKRRVGDNVTPIGEFRVRWINEDSKFKLFFGFDYPSPHYAQVGYLRGDLDSDQYGRIIEASRRGQVPLQDTPLGGALGIHGLGDADDTIHYATHWTQGCIALDNHQIAHLAGYVTVGTRVVIKP
ncbi:MAG: L,D-transpeptidase [Pseudomonadota bacterium]